MNPIFIIAESLNDFIDFCQRRKLDSEECIYLNVNTFKKEIENYSKSITFKPLLEIHVSKFAMKKPGVKTTLFDFITEKTKDLSLKIKTVIEEDNHVILTTWSRQIIS